MRHAGFYLICMITLVIVACVNFKEAGRDAADGAMEAVDNRIPDLIGTGGNAFRDSILEQRTQERLDSILVSLLNELTMGAEAMRDSVLGVEMRQLLSEQIELFGDSVQLYVQHIRDELLGARTRMLVSDLRSDLLGEKTLSDVKVLRDELLGPRTHEWIQAIVDSAMTTLINRYHQGLKPELEKQLSFIQRNAARLLILGAALTLLIAWFIWWLRKKYVNMLKMITKQIHDIPEQPAYDELVKRIQNKAQELSLEPKLRKVLAKQGILGPESWKPPKSSAI